MKMYDFLRAFVVSGLVLSGAGLMADEFDASQVMMQYSSPDCNSCGNQGNDCCGGNGSCCANSCSNGGHFLFGVEATFLAPIGNSVQTWSLEDQIAGTTSGFTSDSSGIENLVPAPRVWLGFVNECGWGAQVRYWELNSSANTSDIFVPFGPDLDTSGFSSTNSIQMQALDIEAVRTFCYCDWNVMSTFGYRHAMRDSQGTLCVEGLVGRPTFLGAGIDSLNGCAMGISRFEGDGLTFSLAGSRPTCYGVELFWNFRGSVLWGDAYSRATASAAVGTPFGSANYSTGAVAGGADDLWIGELQTGAQWTCCLPCSNARFFLRGAFEYQYWGSTSGNTFAAADAGELGVSRLNVTASSPDSSLNLVGFALSSGITW